MQNKTMKVLFLGDIVGAPARACIKARLAAVITEGQFDFVVANGENAAQGSGITPSVVQELFASGIDILTLGDHTFRKKDGLVCMSDPRIVRPLNWSRRAIGHGTAFVEKNGKKLGVMALIGRVFMDPYDSPFDAALDALPQLKQQTPCVLVDMHAEATSEKIAMTRFLAGKASAVIGTHTHVPTADERIVAGYTGAITDCGMSGSIDSVLGRDAEKILLFFSTNMPASFDVTDKDVRLQGVSLTLDETTGACLHIKRVEYCSNSAQGG
jgi:metallophosphoesterase (TIGR00282 family)